jgi:hypothetical protein
MKQISERKIFHHTKTSYSARYYSFLWMILFYIVYPIINGGFIALLDFIYGVFFRDLFVSLVALSPIMLWQIWSIYATRNSVKTLEIQDDLVIIKFFGILKEKSLQLNYSDIFSLEWSQDNLKHFVFNLKNGEKKLIKTEIVDRNKAFDLIQQKIKEDK